MTASIVSLPNCCAGSLPFIDGAEEPSPDQFETYVGCLMSTGYVLSGSLLALSQKSALQYLAKFIDDPALLAKVAAHPENKKLSKFLLGFVLLEHAKGSLWDDIEDLMRRR